jgi:hypothetical protein
MGETPACTMYCSLFTDTKLLVSRWTETIGVKFVTFRSTFLYALSMNYEFILTIFTNPLTPELKPSAQFSLTRFFTGDFAS